MTKSMQSRKTKATEMVEQLNEMFEQYPQVVNQPYELLCIPYWRQFWICLTMLYTSEELIFLVARLLDKMSSYDNILAFVLFAVEACIVTIFAVSALGVFQALVRLELYPGSRIERSWFFRKDMKQLEETYRETNEKVMAYLAQL